MMPPALRATSPASPLRKSRLPRLTGGGAREAGGGKAAGTVSADFRSEIFENGLRGLPPPPRKTAHLPRKTGEANDLCPLRSNFVGEESHLLTHEAGRSRGGSRPRSLRVLETG